MRREYVNKEVNCFEEISDEVKEEEGIAETTDALLSANFDDLG